MKHVTVYFKLIQFDLIRFDLRFDIFNSICHRMFDTKETVEQCLSSICMKSTCKHSCMYSILHSTRIIKIEVISKHRIEILSISGNSSEVSLILNCFSLPKLEGIFFLQGIDLKKRQVYEFTRTVVLIYIIAYTDYHSKFIENFY